VLFSAEGTSRAGLGCCTPPLASNFRSNDASTLRAAAIDLAAVEREKCSGSSFLPSYVRAGRVNEWLSRRAAFAAICPYCLTCNDTRHTIGK
jgi:hypothetical protein